MRFLSAVALPVLILLPWPVKHAQSQDGVGVFATAHGVTVSLLVPGTTYPRDALISATVVVRNDSSEKTA